MWDRSPALGYKVIFGRVIYPRNTLKKVFNDLKCPNSNFMILDFYKTGTLVPFGLTCFTIVKAHDVVSKITVLAEYS